MKVGEYVRTKDYGFIKVKSFYYNEDMIHILDENCNEYDFSKELVDEFKSSPDIIDLIEVGDYVNGQKVHKNDEYDYLYLIAIDGDGNYYEDSIRDIESIVTKEQFEAIKYEIK